jgi:hypothetical protein
MTLVVIWQESEMGRLWASTTASYTNSLKTTSTMRLEAGFKLDGLMLAVCVY